MHTNRNDLQALPIEFTDVLEAVSVSLDENPWSLLPKRWGRRYGDKHCPDADQGIRTQDALHFLYCMRTIYDVAAAVWRKAAAFYMTGRLGCEDFVSEVQERVGQEVWRDEFVQHAELLYFSVRHPHCRLVLYYVVLVIIDDIGTCC
jgi:hypothetical protein